MKDLLGFYHCLKYSNKTHLLFLICYWILRPVNVPCERNLTFGGEHKLRLQNFLSNGNVSECSCPLWGCACLRTAWTYFQGSLYFSLYHSHGLGTWIRTDSTGTQQEISLLSQRGPLPLWLWTSKFDLFGASKLIYLWNGFFFIRSVFFSLFPPFSQNHPRRDF